MTAGGSVWMATTRCTTRTSTTRTTRCFSSPTSTKPSGACSAFLPRNSSAGRRWQLELGGRYNRIESDAGEVNATPAMMGMPPAVALRDNFNGADRSLTDNNVDLVAKLRFEAADNLSYYAGSRPQDPGAVLSGALPVAAAAGNGRSGGWPHLHGQPGPRIGGGGGDRARPRLRRQPSISRRDCSTVTWLTTFRAARAPTRQPSCSCG